MTDETERSVEDTRRAVYDAIAEHDAYHRNPSGYPSHSLLGCEDIPPALTAHEDAIRRKERRDVLAPSVEDDDCRCK